MIVGYCSLFTANCLLLCDVLCCVVCCLVVVDGCCSLPFVACCLLIGA